MTKGSALQELTKGITGPSASKSADLGSGGAHPPGAPEIDEAAEAFAAEADLFGGASVPAPKRSPGRPVGAKDRSTVQLQAFMRARGYRDPAEFLGALISMDTKDLSRALCLETVDALKIQAAAARDLLPYWHRKRPIEVEHTGDGARPLIIMMDDKRAIAAKGDGAMSIYDGEENQSLISQLAGGSHDDGSHDRS
jgi:hypothetical protein